MMTPAKNARLKKYKKYKRYKKYKNEKNLRVLQGTLKNTSLALPSHALKEQQIIFLLQSLSYQKPAFSCTFSCTI